MSVGAANALAIAGGRPAVAPDSHVRWPVITASDREAIARVLDRGVLWGPNAPEVGHLQEEWANYVGTRHCLLVNSGTAALHCALVACGVGPGDEVVVPAFSFVATAMAVIHAGAVPVFCDIDPELHSIDTRLIEERLTERTRAVLPVHVHGLPADMEELRTICRGHGLAVVEDACQGHGALYRGVRVGALGDAGAFSLNGSKLLAAGEGGLLVSNDDDAFVAARRLAIFGEDTPPLPSPTHTRAYWSHGTGWNYRSSELVAALARSQLRRLDDWVAIAQRNAAILTEGLRDLPGFGPPQIPEDRTSVFYRYRIRLRPEELGWSGPPLELRDRLLHALRGEGIAADLWQLLPLPAQPALHRPLARWDPQEHPEAMRLLERSIVLGTADEPIFCQPPELVACYLAGFQKVVAGLERVLTGEYPRIEPWPPWWPPPL